ncbi:MAG: hypothetical protein P4M11_02060 [Candidatus Pacebacteria bacterium]|nr:hypothetical protein [Candidatus Paceibacterota bacterium]
MRRLIYNFMRANRDFRVNGLPISAAADTGSLDTYMEEVVLKQGEDARDLVFPIMPLLLRINIGIVLLDTKDKTNVLSPG